MLEKYKYTPKDNFTKVPNEIIYNNNLSGVAKTLFIFLLGLKENYHPTFKDIIIHGGFTNYGIVTAVKELMDKGIISTITQPIPKIIDGKKVYVKKNVYRLNNPEVWKPVILKERDEGKHGI